MFGLKNEAWRNRFYFLSLFFFFSPFSCSWTGDNTDVNTAQLDWKSSWSTSSRIQTVQGYLQKSFKRVREWRPPQWRKRLTKSLHRMNNLCFGAWDGPAAAQEHQQREWASKATASGGTTETRWGQGSLLPSPLPGGLLVWVVRAAGHERVGNV